MTIKLLTMSMTCDTPADVNYLRNLCLQNKVEMKQVTGKTLAEAVYPNVPAAMFELVFSSSAAASTFRSILTTAGHTL